MKDGDIEIEREMKIAQKMETVRKKNDGDKGR